MVRTRLLTYLITLLTYLLHGEWIRDLLERPIGSQSRNSPRFMEPEGSSPHSQVHSYVVKPPKISFDRYKTEMKLTNILADSAFHNAIFGVGVTMLGDISLLFGLYVCVFSQMYPHLFGTCLCT